MIYTFKNLKLKGLILIQPKIFEDERGYFLETYSQKDFMRLNLPVFIQDNQSYSKKGVIRGLHFQKPPFTQSKLIRVVKGAVLVVALDIRKKSETYGKWISLELTDKNFKQLYIPEGFATGISVLSDDAITSYKVSKYYNRDSEGGIIYNDLQLNIPWPVKEPIISEKDKHWPKFNDFQSPF